MANSARLVGQAASCASSNVICLSPSDFGIDDQTTIILPTRSSDPGRRLLNLAKSVKSTPAVLLTPSDPVAISRIVPWLSKLATLPAVINIATKADHTPVTSLMQAPGITVLFSSSAQQAQINALVALRVATQSRSAVVHFFEVEDQSSGKLLTKTQLTAAKKYINAATTSTKANGHSNGHTNGLNGDDAVSIDLNMEHVVQSAMAALPKNLGQASTQEHVGSPSPETLLLAVGSAITVEEIVSQLPATAALVNLSLLSPLSEERVQEIVSSSVKKIIVLEQAYTQATKLGGPLFLDIAALISSIDSLSHIQVIGRSLGKIGTVNASAVKAELQALLADDTPFAGSSIGDIVPAAAYATELRVPQHEQAYTRILDQLFGQRLKIANSVDPSLDNGDSSLPSSLPELALGKLLADRDTKTNLKNAVKALLSDSSLDSNLQSSLAKWLSDPTDSNAIDAIKTQLSSPQLSSLSPSSSAFDDVSNWIIGSDAWAYDLGTSGVHHALSSGVNVNILIIDAQPYAGPEAVADPEVRAKKDIGLYAMNYGNAYVASVAVYGDYSQTVRALSEADKFDGPSIVLAYLPGGDVDSAKALNVLKETKRAVDSGYWPLYRWNPLKAVDYVPADAPKQGGRAWKPSDDKDAFQLDSERIKADMRAFLDRQNHLTLLSRQEPILADSIVGSFGKEIQDAVESEAKKAFEKLSGAIDGPSLLVLYASDGGNAEKLAKKFTARARSRGIGARCLVMEEVSVEDLSMEPYVALFTSVAGQGEFPGNGRKFWKALQALSTALGPSGGAGKSLDQVSFSVFGLGDSHYWPRPEDAHYYNKSCKDLDAKLDSLGATRIVDLGLGNDQDADGYMTAYKVWEPSMWKVLGVGEVEVVEAEPEPVTNEHIKIASNFLRGTIKEGLNDKSTGALSESDGQLTKFHGIYQQDDRDIRDERKEQGLEPAYSFMVRVRVPAGVCTASQWLQMNEISDTRGNHTFKMTTRQAFQFHGIIKGQLKPAIQEINKAALDTVAACGDVNRNVLCTANPSIGKLHAQVHEFSAHLSEHLMPQTAAYAEIWLDKKLVAGDAVKAFHEPLYGPYYLPRKFKIAVAVPPHNDVDVFCHDVGFIAIVDPKTKGLQGFNVTIGGGMGVTHAMKSTYPRLGDIIGFATPEQAVDVAEKIMLAQRDHGNRANRKNARLKYTIDRMGLSAFVEDVESRLGYKLEPAREYKFQSNTDEFGWFKGDDGKNHCTVFIENGRVEDVPGKQQKTGLAEIAKVHKGVFRMTGNQHLVIADVADDEKPKIEALMAKYNLDKFNHSGLRLSSSACVAFPTCGLAMAESERFLPGLIDRIEKILEEVGLRHDSIVMRVTGCPNGCARPYAAEVAFVGKAANSYLFLLGGGFYGQRLNKIYREAVSEDEIVEIMRPMLKSYAHKREAGERFGDFAVRQGWISATTSGKEWYDKMTEGKEVSD